MDTKQKLQIKIQVNRILCNMQLSVEKKKFNKTEINK